MTERHARGFADKLFSKSKLLNQIWEKFSRDQQNLPPYLVLRKAVRYAEGLAFSPLYLRHCSSVGKRARTRGRPFIENLGRIVIGDDFNFVSLFVQSHLVTGPSGLLEIGDSVSINFGAAISAHEHIKIGNRVRIGPYAMIMDSDYHSAKDRDERPSAPIEIGDDVWLAGRVSVLKGSKIGAGSVITAGSVVSGEIPARVIAGGVPARVLRKLDGGDPAVFNWNPVPEVKFTSGLESSPSTMPAVAPEAAISSEASTAKIAPTVNTAELRLNHHAQPAIDNEELTARVKSVIAETFGLEGPVDLNWGMNDIPKWDSLGQLRLTMSIEESFGISISETELVNMTSVGQVCRIVRESVGGRA